MTSDKITTNVKLYSQAAASAAVPSTNTHPHPLPNKMTYSQIQIRNREEIKCQQVLINFDKTLDAAIDSFDETTLLRKSLNSLDTTWVATSDPKPPPSSSSKQLS